MGNFVWYEYSRYVSLTACVCEFAGIGFKKYVLMTGIDTIWASFWGMFYRKFFWDFIGGTLRDPGGLQCVHPSIPVPPTHPTNPNTLSSRIIDLHRRSQAS